MYTVKDVRERLGVSEPMVYKLLTTGKIPSYKVGRILRIEPKDVDNYLARVRRG